jgi:hypothetical protein
MAETLAEQIDTYLRRLDQLIRAGRALEAALAADPASGPALAATAGWQRECGAIVNELSGGSKAHWLSRSYSEAFLMRAAEGRVIEGAAPAEIVSRLAGVLERAVESLSGMRNGPHAVSSEPPSPPSIRRFDFVHNRELRPVLEQAYSASRDALDQGRFTEALLTSCGVLEAIVTDALEHRGLDALAAVHPPSGHIGDWPVEARLAVAERAGLISKAWARLPEIARRYRELSNAGGEPDPHAAVSERDARQARQVLQIVMRDLDPGR